MAMYTAPRELADLLLELASYRSSVTADQHRHNRPCSHPAVDNLVAQLTKLPGVGQRTAQRLAFHLLSRPKDEALALAGRSRT